MSNLMTDQLMLARKRYSSGFLFLKFPLKPLENYTQVVFQGDRYIGSVSPDGNSVLNVLKDDIIISIAHAPRLYVLTGTISTRDKYKRIYELPIQVMASDYERVARAYLQEKDPAKQALDMLKLAFEKYASNIDYDRVQTIKLPFDEWNMTKWVAAGIHLEQAGKTMFRQDPQYTDPDVERLKLQEETKRKEEILRAESTIQELQEEIARKREIVRKEFERQEKTKDQIYTICSDLRTVAAQEITVALKERIHEGFESGRSTSEISDEYFALMSIFEDSTHIKTEQSIIAGMFVEGNVDYADETFDEMVENMPPSEPHTHFDSANLSAEKSTLEEEDNKPD